MNLEYEVQAFAADDRAVIGQIQEDARVTNAELVSIGELTPLGAQQFMRKLEEQQASYEGSLSKPFLAFTRRQLVNALLHKGQEKRREHRHPMIIPAFVVPVNEDNEPIGDAFEVMTRDVASASIGLFHEEPLRYKRLILNMILANTEVNLIIQIIWRGALGPFYGSAGWYVERVDSFPG